MSERNENEGKNLIVLEGIYKGIVGKLDLMQTALKNELQFANAQHLSAYEAVKSDVLNELKYIAQQNSAIFEYNDKTRQENREEITKAVEASKADILQAVGEQIAAAKEELLEAIRAAALTAQSDCDLIAQKVREAILPEEGEVEVEESAEEGVDEDVIDYEVLAEKIASILPETDYDVVAEKIAAALPETDYDVVAERLASAVPPTDYDLLADKVAAAVPQPDYDLFAEKVKDVLPEDEKFANNVSDKVSGVIADQFDLTINEEGIELIAKRVAELLKEEGLVARAVVEEEAVAEAVAVEETVEEPVEEAVEETVEEVVEEAPVEEEVIVEETVEKAQEPVEEIENEEEVVGLEETANDPSLVIRYKRSFIAKITQSEEEVKDYYSEIKNAFLSYGKVRSQVSWSNDRFNKGRETVAKVGVRGKTLCLYLALNPDEFPLTVYHQKFAGDTKMYEKTPMMVKVKSNVGLKRAIRLIEYLLEKEGAVKTEDFKPVDYSKMYKHKSDKKLLAEGLIKTAMVEKTDMDF